MMARARTQPGSSPSLTSLPVEILFIILQWVDNRALLDLARTCHLLQAIPLSEYLDRHGILHPPSKDMTIFNDSEYSILPIIGAVYPLHALDALTLWFFQGFSDVTCRQLDAARLFICRSAYIRACSLYVSDVYLGDTVASAAQFLLSLSKLLDALDGKLHRRLNIGTFYASSYTEMASRSFRVTARPLRSLSEVRIRGGTLPHPCYIDWAIETLNSSPITHLHISLEAQPFKDVPSSSAFFHRLMLPRLLVLDVEGPEDCTGLTPPKFSKFLARHSTLRSLRWLVRRRYTAWPALPAHVLPNLTALEAEADVAWAVLRRGGAPRLRRLALVNVGIGRHDSEPCIPHPLLSVRDETRSRSGGAIYNMENALACLVGRAEPVDLHVQFTLMRYVLATSRCWPPRVERQIRCVTALTIKMCCGMCSSDPVRGSFGVCPILSVLC